MLSIDCCLLDIVKGKPMNHSSKCALMFSAVLLLASTNSLATTQGYLHAKQKISNEIVSCLKNGGMEGKAALNECYYDAAMSFSKSRINGGALVISTIARAFSGVNG